MSCNTLVITDGVHEFIIFTIDAFAMSLSYYSIKQFFLQTKMRFHQFDVIFDLLVSRHDGGLSDLTRCV